MIRRTPIDMSFVQIGGLTRAVTMAHALPSAGCPQIRITNVRFSQKLFLSDGTRNRTTLLLRDGKPSEALSGPGLTDKTGSSDRTFHKAGSGPLVSKTRTIAESAYFLCTRI